MNAIARKPAQRITHAAYEAQMAVIVRMHLIQRKPPSEIADKVGVPVERVKDRLYRAGYRLPRPQAVHTKPLGGVEDYSLPSAENDDTYVGALLAAGGLPRLSEKLTRQGHVACLPLIPYGARP